MALSAFQAGLGVTHGRLAVSAAPAGAYVFELGSSNLEDRYFNLNDYISCAQTSIEFDAQTTLVRVQANIRLPTTLVGAVWALTARLNSTIRYTRYLRAEQRTLTLTDIAIPTIGATGGPTNTISLRLTLEAA